MRKLLSTLLFIGLSLGIQGQTAKKPVTKPAPQQPVKKKEQPQVYICESRSAYAYHSSLSCHGLQRCSHEIAKVSETKAKELGYRPCKICY